MTLLIGSAVGFLFMVRSGCFLIGATNQRNDLSHVHSNFPQFFDNAIFTDGLIAEYQTLFHNGGYTTEKFIWYKNVTREYAENLTRVLTSRFENLMNIKYKVVELEKDFIYDYDMEPFNYFNTRNKPPNPVVKNITFTDKIAVNTNHSHVHVPTEIYMYDRIILNTAGMSKPLDSVFINNYQRDSTLLWQYYCSTPGAFRMYPGEAEK